MTWDTSDTPSAGAEEMKAEGGAVESWPVSPGPAGAEREREPLSRLCSDNATLRLRVSLQSGHNVTAGLGCSQTFTFVAVSQTIYFPEFH